MMASHTGIKRTRLFDGLVKQGKIMNIEPCTMNVVIKKTECTANTDIYIYGEGVKNKRKICRNKEKLFFIGDESDGRAENGKTFLLFARGRHGWKNRAFIGSHVTNKREVMVLCACDKKGKDVNGNCYYCAMLEGKPVWVHERFAAQMTYGTANYPPNVTVGH